MSTIGRKVKRFFKTLGPGLITGAADDDPSGIATYTQAGAKFGYGQLWLAFLTVPLMTAVQEACARIGAVTGKGLAAVIKAHYGPKLLYSTVFLVVLANTINLGADLGAMGAAAQLLWPEVNFAALTIIFALAILLLQIFLSYKTYARILKWLALSLLAYPVTVFLVKQPWPELLRATFVPHIEFSFDFLLIAIAVLGTSISPYLFFWEASEEVEEEKSKHMIKNGKPRLSEGFMRRLRLDNFIGMFSSQAVMWCIVVVGGTILRAGGVTEVGTAAEAAKALEPLVNTFPNSGFLAQLIFAVGVIGLGFLAVPVLSGSAAYALSEAFNWKEGLNRSLKKAHGFYGIIIVATLVGLLMNFVGIDPIKALIFAAVFNGIAAVPLIMVIAMVAQREDIMGEHKSGRVSKTLVWATFALMAASAVAMFIALGKG